MHHTRNARIVGAISSCRAYRFVLGLAAQVSPNLSVPHVRVRSLDANVGYHRLLHDNALLSPVPNRARAPDRTGAAHDGSPGSYRNLLLSRGAPFKPAFGLSGDVASRSAGDRRIRVWLPSTKTRSRRSPQLPSHSARSGSISNPPDARTDRTAGSASGPRACRKFKLRAVRSEEIVGDRARIGNVPTQAKDGLEWGTQR